MKFHKKSLNNPNNFISNANTRFSLNLNSNELYNNK